MLHSNSIALANRTCESHVRSTRQLGVMSTFTVCKGAGGTRVASQRNETNCFTSVVGARPEGAITISGAVPAAFIRSDLDAG